MPCSTYLLNCMIRIRQASAIIDWLDPGTRKRWHAPNRTLTCANMMTTLLHFR